tara:strand:- start:577 stop:714 length:138 start_codon:yes stop_codon:yes gene_type:complete
MNKQINESIKFLLSEYKRLKMKQKEKKITKEEKETLIKLKSFLGK